MLANSNLGSVTRDIFTDEYNRLKEAELDLRAAVAEFRAALATCGFAAVFRTLDKVEGKVAEIHMKNASHIMQKFTRLLPAPLKHRRRRSPHYSMIDSSFHTYDTSTLQAETLYWGTYVLS